MCLSEPDGLEPGVLTSQPNHVSEPGKLEYIVLACQSNHGEHGVNLVNLTLVY